MKLPPFRQVRDPALFLTGVAGILHETVVAATPRESLLLLFAACLGLPAFIRADEHLTARRKDER